MCWWLLFQTSELSTSIIRHSWLKHQNFMTWNPERWYWHHLSLFFYFRDFLLHILHKTVKLFAHIKDFRVQDGVYDRLKRVDLSYTVGWNRGKTKGKALFHFSFRVKKRRERLFFIFHFRVKKRRVPPKTMSDYAVEKDCEALWWCRNHRLSLFGFIGFWWRAVGVFLDIV